MHAMQEERGASLTARRVPRLAWISLLVALVVVVVDQLTKIWALRALTPGESVPVIGDLIRLTIIRNPGAAFSIGNQATWLLTLVAVVVLAVVLGSLRRLGHLGWALCLGLLLGGAVGNLVDRLVRAPGVGRGHVVDFIDYGGLFIGNVADIAIVAAALSVAVLAWKGIGLDGSRETRESGDAETTGSPAGRADDA